MSASSGTAQPTVAPTAIGETFAPTPQPDSKGSADGSTGGTATSPLTLALIGAGVLLVAVAVAVVTVRLVRLARAKASAGAAGSAAAPGLLDVHEYRRQSDTLGGGDGFARTASSRRRAGGGGGMLVNPMFSASAPTVGEHLADRDSRPTPNHPEYGLLNNAGMYATNPSQMHQEGYDVLERAGHDHGSADQTYAIPVAAGSTA